MNVNFLTDSNFIGIAFPLLKKDKNTFDDLIDGWGGRVRDVLPIIYASAH
jgi:hypothetical protein